MLYSDGQAVRTVPEERTRQAFLVLELATLFVILPTLYMAYRPFLIHPFPVVWGFAAFCAWILKRDGRFSWRDLPGAPPGRERIKAVVRRFAFLAVPLMAYVLLFEPGRVLAFPRSSPVSWLLFVLLYPIVSVVPQGIIYRVFFFRRYRELFGSGWTMIAASAMVFSYAHIIYRNPIAIILTLLGGLFLAHTHARNDSPWLSNLEHALYGDFVFTIGLGCYICSGTIQ